MSWGSAWLLRIALGLSLLGMLGGFVLWATADSGTKAVDLGSSLIATGFFGLLFIGLERALGARVEAGTEAVGGLLPSGSDDRDEGAPIDLADARPPSATPIAPPSDPFPHEFHVEYGGWQRDASRIDAYQVRLRVFRDGQYFQFFTGVVPGITVRFLNEAHSDAAVADRLKRACAQVTIRMVKDRIIQGQVPLPDPTNASEVLLSPEAIEARIRTVSKSSEPLAEGEELDRWLM